MPRAAILTDILKTWNIAWCRCCGDASRARVVGSNPNLCRRPIPVAHFVGPLRLSGLLDRLYDFVPVVAGNPNRFAMPRRRPPSLRCFRAALPSGSRVERMLPMVHTLRNYRRGYLRPDFVAATAGIALGMQELGDVTDLRNAARPNRAGACPSSSARQLTFRSTPPRHARGSTEWRRRPALGRCIHTARA